MNDNITIIAITACPSLSQFSVDSGDVQCCTVSETCDVGCMVVISDSSNVNISFTLPCLNVTRLTFNTKDLTTPMGVVSLTENGENTSTRNSKFYFRRRYVKTDIHVCDITVDLI